jgi:hypothetical protein
MIEGPFFITPHAIERYQQRVDVSCNRKEAFDALLRISKVARFAKELPPRNGVKCEQWRGPKPDKIRLIVVHNARGPAVVSVKKGPGW